jgi:hypothetical protein
MEHIYKMDGYDEMLLSEEANFEIDDSVDKFSLKNKLDMLESYDNLFVVCKIIKYSSSIITIKVAFNISDIEDIELDFFRFGTFYLMYGTLTEISNALLPNDVMTDIVLISPNILIKNLMKNPLGMIVSSDTFFSKVHSNFTYPPFLPVQNVSKRMKQLVNENITIFGPLANNFKYSNDSIRDICRGFGKLPAECILRLNCNIRSRGLIGKSILFEQKLKRIIPNLKGILEPSDVKVFLTITINSDYDDKYYKGIYWKDLYSYIGKITEKFPNTLSLTIIIEETIRSSLKEDAIYQEEFRKMLEPLKILNTLRFSNMLIPVNFFIEYIRSLDNLQELRLCHVELKTVDFNFDDFCENFQEAMKNVDTFELKGSHVIERNILQYEDKFWNILSQLPKLKSLYFTEHDLPEDPFTDDISDDYFPFDLEEIGTGLSSLTQLTFLSLSKCGYTPRSIRELLSPVLGKLVNLVTLDLSQTIIRIFEEEDVPSMNREMIEAFIPILQILQEHKLRILIVSDNPLLNEEDITYLIRSLPLVKIIYN